MSVVSLCLGLDISPKRLGWALARLEDGAPVACGVEAIELPENGWHHGSLAAATRWLSAKAKLEGGEIHYVAIELPALVAKSGPKSAFMAGRAYQEAYSAVRRRWPWAVVDEMQPSEWRTLAGRVSSRMGWGGLKGNATKAEVAHVAWAVLVDVNGGDWSPEDADAALRQQDAADALCIALAGVERNRQTLATPAGEAGR